MAWSTKLATAQPAGNTAVIAWGGGAGAVAVGETFDGATAKLQFSPDDGSTWFDIDSAVEFTAPGVGVFTLPDCQLRLNVAGGTSPLVEAWLELNPTKVQSTAG